jgi:leucyl aminopeptidase
MRRQKSRFVCFQSDNVLSTMLLETRPDRFLLGINHSGSAVPLVLLTPATRKAYMKAVGIREQHFVSQMRQEADYTDDWVVKDRVRKSYVNVRSSDTNIANPYDYLYALSDHARSIRAQRYKLDGTIPLKASQIYNLTLGWGLGGYAFHKYKTKKQDPVATLVIPKGVDQSRLMRELSATAWVQDIINEPPSTMNPEALAAEATGLAEKFGAYSRVIVGNQLLKKNYPLVHAVGRGAATRREREPRLFDMRWGNPDDPAIVLAGKGVTFDSGGKNGKIDQDALLDMKTDKAGAAHALALAYMVMDARLPVHLRVLLPIVENSEGPDAYKPGDIIKNRMGESVYIINTDCEGRLIMSDALFEASHPTGGAATPKPELIVDFTTLSWHGNSEFPNYGCSFANSARLQAEFLGAVRRSQEYFTPRPLLRELMRELEDSHQADIRQCNANSDAADDLLATLLLSRNVDDKIDWLHNDLQVWRSDTHERTHIPPGLAPGGHAQGLRSSYRLIEDRYSGPAAPEV